MLKNKKLIIINLLTIIAFISVVGVGIRHVESSKGEFNKDEEVSNDKIESAGLLSKSNPSKGAFQFKLKKPGDSFSFLYEKDNEEELDELELEEMEEVEENLDLVTEEQGTSTTNQQVDQSQQNTGIRTPSAGSTSDGKSTNNQSTPIRTDTSGKNDQSKKEQGPSKQQSDAKPKDETENDTMPKDPKPEKPNKTEKPEKPEEPVVNPPQETDGEEQGGGNGENTEE